MTAEKSVISELLPGFSGAVLVTRDGRAVLREAAGIADVETGEELTPDSIFQICSVSKQFAAASVLLSVEDGLLDLRAPISSYLPEAPEAWSGITLHHLLSNSSGLGHWDVVPGFDAEHPYTADEYLPLLAEQPLLFEPGTGWQYSSPAFLLAGTIVERVTGETYREYSTRRIFAPLGMTSTSAGVPVRAAARGYVEGKRADAPEFALLPGAGDIFSTVDDLARYAHAFDAGEILGLESRRLATTPHTHITEEAGTADGTITVEGYGYGYFIGTLLGHRVRFHPGDNPGFHTFQIRLPELDFSIVILSNDGDTDIEDVGLKLLTHLVRAGDIQPR